MSYNPDRPVAGVDLGGTKILAAIVGPGGAIIGRAKKRTKAENGPLEVLKRIALAIREAAASAGLTPEEIAGVGVGSPGPLDPETGVVQTAPNLGWRDIDVRGFLQGEFNIPVFVENDVNAGTLGEYRLGAGQGASSLVGIFVGTGIGGGIVLDGKLHRGFNKTAGEIGHMVVQPGGPVCGCGQKGCLEAVASRTAIDRMIRADLKTGKKSLITDLIKKSDTQIKSRALAEAFEKKDKVVCSALARATEYLGIAVGGLINFLNPETIVLGGGVVEALESYYLPEVRKIALKYSFPNASKDVKIVPSKLGDEAGVLGAAVIAQSHLASGQGSE